MLLILKLQTAKGRRAPWKSWCSHVEKMTSLVAVWGRALSDRVHKIEFEHGTTSKNVLSMLIKRKRCKKIGCLNQWLKKHTIRAYKTKATINMDAVRGFAYEYTFFFPNVKCLKKYMHNRSEPTSIWVLCVGVTDYRAVLENNTMNVQW